MQLSLNRRYANGFTARVNYTLSDLQGTIGVDTAPGRGTRVSIDIPAGGPSTSLRPAPSTSLKPRPSKRT